MSAGYCGFLITTVGAQFSNVIILAIVAVVGGAGGINAGKAVCVVIGHICGIRAELAGIGVAILIKGHTVAIDRIAAIRTVQIALHIALVVAVIDSGIAVVGFHFVEAVADEVFAGLRTARRNIDLAGGERLRNVLLAVRRCQRCALVLGIERQTERRISAAVDLALRYIGCRCLWQYDLRQH